MFTATALDIEPLRAAPPSLDASDEFDAGPAHYCPLQQLSIFTLLMAGHGRSVMTAMMLGDREYAMWQLARAHALDDAELRAVAVRLFAYFEDNRLPAGANRV